MKIKYSERRINSQLISGILMLGIGIFWVYTKDESLLGLLWILAGILQGGTALHNKKNQYLTIEDNRITQHSLFPKSIDINNIKRVRMFVNSYKIETSDKTITIDKHRIQKESLYQLTDYLKNLKLQAHTTVN